jgi:hypothetical protein
MAQLKGRDYLCLEEECGCTWWKYIEDSLMDTPQACPHCESMNTVRTVSAPAVLQASYPDGLRKKKDSWVRLREEQDLKIERSSTPKGKRISIDKELREIRKVTKGGIT